MTREQDFEEMLFEVWLQSQDEASLTAGMTKLADELVSAREALHDIETYDEALFGEDFTAS